MNVLFVCSGNTCRSPMAEALMNALSSQHGLDITADSAGLFAYNGAPISDGAAQVLKEDYQVQKQDHQAKSLDGGLVEWADRIVCMTRAHEALVKEEFPSANTSTLGRWAGNEMDIRDPHGGNIEDYRESAHIIRGLLDDIVNGMKEHGKAAAQ